MAPVIIIFTINIGGVIISEASLSFLGFGLPIEVPSWGGMLSREGREFMEAAPRLALFPGLCLTTIVYCFNMLGDALRDLLDPRLRGGEWRTQMVVETRTETGTWRVKAGLAQMLKGGVIMDVVTAEQARIAEDAGAVAVMALERVPADIRKAGGVARMSDPSKVSEIVNAVTIPVMAKARIGHFVEAQVLEALGVDYVDESEVLTPADENNHINKHDFKVPFVCGARDLGEALRRIGEGAAMIRTKGEAGSGNIVEAVRHARKVLGEVRRIQNMDVDELMATARDLKAPYNLVKEVRELGRLPVVNFAAGGVSTPADAALMMQLGVDGIFVGSGIFKSQSPDRMADAIVKATTHYRDPAMIADVSKGLGDAMAGLDVRSMPESEQLATRGW